MNSYTYFVKFLLVNCKFGSRQSLTTLVGVRNILQFVQPCVDYIDWLHHWFHVWPFHRRTFAFLRYICKVFNKHIPKSLSPNHNWDEDLREKLKWSSSRFCYTYAEVLLTQKPLSSYLKTITSIMISTISCVTSIKLSWCPILHRFDGLFRLTAT